MGLRKAELTRYWRKLHCDGVNDFSVLTKYYLGNKIKTEETARIYDTYGRERKCMQNFCG